MFASRLSESSDCTQPARIWICALGLVGSISCVPPVCAQSIRIDVGKSEIRSLGPPQDLVHSASEVVSASHTIPVNLAQDLEPQVPAPAAVGVGAEIAEPHWTTSPSDLEAIVPIGPPRISAYPETYIGSQLPVYDGFQMGCLGAKHWIPSDILRSRAKAIIQLYCDEDECSRRAAAVLANFLRMEALHQEGIGAASAMRGYYTRIGLADQLVMNAQSKVKLQEAKSQQEALLKEGLAAGTDMSSFDRLQIDARGAELEILARDRKLQTLLTELSKVDYPMNGIQQEPLEVIENPLDCAALHQIALATRMDLKAWIYLHCHVNEKTAPIFAKMLPTLIGGYSLPMPTVCGLKKLFCKPDYSCLAANMRHEIQLTIETHRRWISQAVSEKCNDLQLAYEKINLAKETLSSWERRLKQLERLQVLGEARPKELAEARTAILKAQSDVISRSIEARNAEVSLAEATGGLSQRCCSRVPWLLTGY